MGRITFVDVTFLSLEMFYMSKRDSLYYIQQVQALLLSPICPHLCEHIWRMIGKVSRASLRGKKTPEYCFKMYSNEKR
jgi:leucyl-tRNA synthetase